MSKYKSKTAIKKEIESLNQQANATMSLAELAEPGPNKEKAYEAAATISALVAKKSIKEEPGEVALLPASASKIEVAAVRRRRSVCHGTEVYLPSWRDETIGLPNLLLRSSLFAAVKVGEMFKDKILSCYGDATLTMTGPQLCDYDKKVFAVCLNYYRDKCLSSEEDPLFIHTTFWQFSKELQVAYGVKVHEAIRASLIRLNDVSLRVRVRRHDIPVSQLLDVALQDSSYTSSDNATVKLRGSDIITFQVLESIASLFGPTDWSSVAKDALNDYSGLVSWIASFYSTHAEPYPIKIEKLFEISGATGPIYSFRRRLKHAILKLQADSVSKDIRISSAEITADSVTVILARWKRKSGSV